MSFIKEVKGKLIVSCQALNDEPLHSSFIMSRMAIAAQEAGAAGIRANSIVDIQAIQDVVDLPVIGIIKKNYPDSVLHITPTLKEVRQVAATGCEVIAMDATNRERPNNEKLEDTVRIIRQEYPNILLMADIATIEEAVYAERLGFDIVGTTLHGYTNETKGCSISDNYFSFLKDLNQKVDIPIIVEGKIDTPEKAKTAIELGAHAVVVGGAITRPRQIASKFVKAIEG